MVGCPHLVGMLDVQIAQPVGIDPVLGMRPTGVRLGIHRLDTHSPHHAWMRLRLIVRPCRRKCRAIERLPLLALLSAHEPSFLDKKSFSTYGTCWSCRRARRRFPATGVSM
jgi:hypothetical protein